MRFQSTPAIAGGRIHHPLFLGDAGLWFQSTPAIAGGRIITPSRTKTRWPCFNPRPPLLAGESACTPGRSAKDAFQSTPAIASGRIHAQRRGAGHDGRFNPRPPLLAGESKAGTRRYPTWGCFNPRPPLLAGESFAPIQYRLGLSVSIHARHCWRANRSAPALFWAKGWFQSTPAIAGGRIRPAAAPRSARVCFNPRPPLLAGESGCRVVGGNVLLVSIHARHCWRANLHRCANGTLLVCFNPRPPLLAGESRCCGGFMSSEHGFNPRPPLLAGESSDGWPVLMPPSGFNPRPPLLAGESKM